LAALIAALSVPVTANATLALSLDDGLGHSVTIQDGGSGDSNILAGGVTWIGTLGSWILNVSTGVGSALLSSYPFHLDLNSINVTNTSSGGSLTIMLSETGLSYGGAGPTLTASGQIGGVTTGTLGWALFADDNDQLFGTPGTAVLGGTGLTGAFAATDTGTFTLADPGYSLTQVINITQGPNGSTSFNFSADPVPEPGTLALLSLGLLGAGVVSRRRKVSK
jgi:hypothetical protein